MRLGDGSELRVLAGLREDLSLVSRTHMVA